MIVNGRGCLVAVNDDVFDPSNLVFVPHVVIFRGFAAVDVGARFCCDEVVAVVLPLLFGDVALVEGAELVSNRCFDARGVLAHTCWRILCGRRGRMSYMCACRATDEEPCSKT